MSACLWAGPVDSALNILLTRAVAPSTQTQTWFQVRDRELSFQRSRELVPRLSVLIVSRWLTFQFGKNIKTHPGGAVKCWAESHRLPRKCSERGRVADHRGQAPWHLRLEPTLASVSRLRGRCSGKHRGPALCTHGDRWGPAGLSQAMTGPREWPEPVTHRGWDETCVSVRQRSHGPAPAHLPGRCLVPERWGPRTLTTAALPFLATQLDPWGPFRLRLTPSAAPQEHWGLLGLPLCCPPCSLGPREF